MNNLNLVALTASLLIASACVSVIRSNVDVQPVTTINGSHVTDLPAIHVNAYITTLPPIVVYPEANIVASR